MRQGAPDWNPPVLNSYVSYVRISEQWIDTAVEGVYMV